MKKTWLFFLFFITFFSNAQSIKKVLFVGNSYTQYYWLPNLVASCANSTNDPIQISMSLVNDAAFSNHINNQTTLAKINSQEWDYVVLQEHFRRPALSTDYVSNYVFPYATQLSNLIRANYNCSVPIFFNTWGSQNGDNLVCLNGACTYEVMDNLLQERYQMMAETNKGLIAPVAQVWRYLKENHPNLNLYSGDQRHPSINGAMAAAYTFYCIIFRKNPVSVTFRSELDIATANIIKNAVKTVVFDHLDDFYVDSHDNFADFDFANLSSNVVQFENTTPNATNFLWSFGDVTTSALQNPLHNFANPGTYNVNLTLTVCGKTYSKTKPVVIGNLSNEDFMKDDLIVYPNPTSDFLNINISDISSASIFDITGKLIKTNLVNTADGIQIDLRAFSSGIYVLHVIKDNKLQTFKVIKQ